jgi:sensor histidine kinase regulating citrate/malate metabolism
MKLWNKNICLTSRVSLLIIVSLMLSTWVIASVYKVEKKLVVEEEETKSWVPTAEDIAYQDSMYQIIKNTQNDLTDIKKDIVHILERLDYADGTYDSIRYVKGGKIDKRRNQ